MSGRTSVERGTGNHLLACALLLAGAAAHAAAPIAAGTFLIEGQTPGNRQPDGNTVILLAPKGLIVFDTGRHEEHSRQIIDFARARNQPIVAIINSHWHLDHIGGNTRLRAEYPDLEVYASEAISAARKGFLAKYRAQLLEQLAKSPADAAARKDLEAEVALIDQGAALEPTHRIAGDGIQTIAGRSLDVHLESHAVTAGDLWVYDRSTRLLLAGDLVTLPAPFLDTACPKLWRKSLDRLEVSPFLTLIPGHGRPMRRAQFGTYRKAFANLLDCAARETAKGLCTNGWVSDAGSLIEPKEVPYARALVDYYVDNVLRAKDSPNCPSAS